MPNSQQWIQRHWRRLQWGQFLGICADRLAMAFIVIGCLILLTKLFIPALWPYAPALFALLLIVPIWSWMTIQKRKFSMTEATALLDSKLQAGGLLMTLSEAPDEQWSARLPQIEDLWRDSLPRIRPKRFFSLIAVPCLFAIITCFVPIREFSTVMATPRKVAQQTNEELEEILKTLEEEEVLEEEEKEELKQELEKFIEETKNQPLTHEQWETADSLRQQMQLSWEKNERGLESASAAVEELLSSLANQGELSAEQLEQLESALGKNLQSLASKACNGECPGMSESLKKALENAAKSGKLGLPNDAEAREKMLSELKDALKSECEKLAKKRGECQGLCQGNGFCDKPGECNGNKPGRGGISRGRGDAEMMWGKESDLENTKFKEVVLPPGTLDQPNDEVLGLTFKEPEVDPSNTAPRQALRENDPSAGRATWDRKLNPKHRDVVQKFFKTDKPTKAIPEDSAL
ncbi:hypothetical protein [Rubinisphaera sp.]|uniref:hypothetical protein n=1 Tax=Rubinisphaera sp. TaxID=2024857 RepID=UPI000C0F16AF|nr:hypothetical protein [Rubinisphaera sp.]MBV11366.1 hypothetical protein [Rubinisphaera sp.]HCS52669.1 hypothetical protein [Planctomycetaceae bacterium]|tara:strand:+ start:2659 stop:4050 length:1392 start_codon:yes stop_codon:yes gene_type:complete